MNTQIYTAIGSVVLILGILVWSLVRGMRGKGRIK